jgi:glycosyltransferase involved in cell wall biosynthesis
MRILIATDAWAPQVNGVVRTIETLRDELLGMGHAVEVVGPDRFRTVRAPSEPGLRLAVFAGRRLAPIVDAFRPDAVHLATEGPLGVAMRRLALRRGWPFTSCYATKFPEYLKARLYVPERATWGALRWFHRTSAGVMVATPSLYNELVAKGFSNIKSWTRGVDLKLFRPIPGADLGLPRPVFTYIGRVAVEKNIEAFLDLDLPGSKAVVGDGPARAALEKRYPNAHFLGAKFGEELAHAYAASDVFVFPSLTDTFGLVLLEAMACGTPVAAYPVTGPRDVVGHAPAAAALGPDLREAALRALTLSRTAARAHAEQYSWRRCAEMFLANLLPIPPAEPQAVPAAA